jgi:biotin transport system substrate-specific component
MLLGSRLATISVGLYLFLGLIGLPVFTKGGGLGYVFQPTFGYLIGFVFAAMLVGFLVQKIPPVSKFALFYYWGAGFLGVVLVYLTGMCYLYMIMRFYLKTPVAFSALFTIPFLLTIAGDMFKCLVAAFLARRLRPISKNILNQ